MTKEFQHMMRQHLPLPPISKGFFSHTIGDCGAIVRCLVEELQETGQGLLRGLGVYTCLCGWIV